MQPSAWRAGGAEARIRFAIGECSLGARLVASSARGVCALLLGDEPDALARELQDRFPKAELVGGDPDYERVVATVVGFVEAPRIGLDLPLDVRGTAFQERVWRALREIPPGGTASYAEIARRIGEPRAVRAVAGACAANQLAVAIPCHRVVRSDGGLSGYRWGVERKRRLLEREAGVRTGAASRGGPSVVRPPAATQRRGPRGRAPPAARHTPRPAGCAPRRTATSARAPRPRAGPATGAHRPGRCC